MEINTKDFYSSCKNFGFSVLILLVFAFSGCAGRASEKGSVLKEAGGAKKVTLVQESTSSAVAVSEPEKIAASEPVAQPEPDKLADSPPESTPEPPKVAEPAADIPEKSLVAPPPSPEPVAAVVAAGSEKKTNVQAAKKLPSEPVAVLPKVATNTGGQISSGSAGATTVPVKPFDKKVAGVYKKQEIKVLDIPQTSLEDCIACGKSVKELREMGLSEDEIKKEVRKKFDRLNRISRERRREYDKKKEVDFSGIKDCVACGKRGKDLKAMGMTPEQIRAAYKIKYLKLKKQRERNLKSKKGQQLSEKIKEAYSRQKKNMATQLKAEKKFVGLLEENLKSLREVAPPPGPPTVQNVPDEMALVPAGKFLMGAEWGDDTSSMPAKLVYLDAFFMDRKEVNVAAYKKFMKKRLRGRVPFYLRDKDMGADNQPAFKVSWQDAHDFCEGMEKRLPTEAEWEKSARGWDNRLFPWGNELPEKSGRYKANYNPGRKFEDGFLYTAPVGSFSRWSSPYGVMDLTGNVWEWTADWYDEGYYKTGPDDNPRGPTEGKERVIRGGGYNTPLKRLLLTTRLKERPNMRRGYLGFRCAMSVK